MCVGCAKPADPAIVEDIIAAEKDLCIDVLQRDVQPVIRKYTEIHDSDSE